MLRPAHAIFEGSMAAWHAIRAHAMRSMLTTLGIIIGVAAVIAVVAIMQGLSHTIAKQLDDMGSNVVTLQAHTSRDNILLGFENTLSYMDFDVLRAKVENLEHISVSMKPFSFGSSVQYGRNSAQTQIIGTDSAYQNVFSIYPESGRFISESDDLRRRRVAFVGTSVIKKLNMEGNPLGEFISLNGEWFRIIGIAEQQGTFFGFDQDNYIITPFSTMKSLNGEQVTQNVDVFYSPKSGADNNQITEQIRKILRKRHKLTGDDEDDFEFVSAEKARSRFEAITGSITLVAGGVVGVSLLVGGIGVMNIMLVSVTERTREIGTLKALGATPGFIMIQFLIESLVLSLFGGILGLLLGYGIATFLSIMIPGMPGALVPGWAVALALGFTTAIGVIFGLAPAMKAANLNPIDALRYE